MLSLYEQRITHQVMALPKEHKLLQANRRAAQARMVQNRRLNALYEEEKRLGRWFDEAYGFNSDVIPVRVNTAGPAKNGFAFSNTQKAPDKAA
jgi:hypothetical protein